ncbi:MarR family transcriptional regulator [Streptomyces sp. NA04227]|uniref:MarR family winged helix-turn-helix transcriptional regulator n=1 Tax=Streptomyces sp. NA04227 TaxID=2742136 RepID=UPI0015910929|nr:MarR family transcriptional regulator [Streptomyces sp. NA04227]QKW08399.1 MarR family transcriptional regulator [Streptomyces sp. NA04227]
MPQPTDADAAPLVPGTVATHTGCLLLKLGQVVFRISDERLSSLGLRVRHYSVLQALADNGSMSQLDLGAYLRIDAATMVSTLDTLEKAGYARRVRDPQDRRRYVVELADPGRTVVASANELLAEVDDLAFAELARAEREELHTSLRKLADGQALPRAFDEVRGG